MSRCIVQDYGDEAQFWDEKLVRARKEYRCVECSETISVGDLHQRIRMLCDGYWSTDRTCARCVNVFEDYFGGVRVVGGMVEDFDAEHGIDYRDADALAGVPPCTRVEVGNG